MTSFRPVRADASPARELVAAMLDELRTLYGPVERNDMPTATAEEMWAPHGTFLVGDRGGEPVCCGAVKRLADGLAEVKRMYVRPAARRQGVARELLAALEEAARGLGYACARLDTGPRQPHARALYLSAGYAEIDNDNGNPVASFWGERAL